MSHALPWELAPPETTHWPARGTPPWFAPHALHHPAQGPFPRAPARCLLPYRGRVHISPSDSHSVISLGTRWPRRKPTASRESRGLETERAMSGPPQVLTIWGTAGFRGGPAHQTPVPAGSPAAPQASHTRSLDTWPQLSAQGRHLLPPTFSRGQTTPGPRSPSPSPCPRHQFQRSKEEVHEFCSAGVLNVLL